jgi:hypothetical protein
VGGAGREAGCPWDGLNGPLSIPRVQSTSLWSPSWVCCLAVVVPLFRTDLTVLFPSLVVTVGASLSPGDGEVFSGSLILKRKPLHH